MLDQSTIAADWSIAQKMMEKSLGENLDQGFAKLKRTYARNKKQLFEHFDEVGRIVTKDITECVITKSEYINILDNIKCSIFSKISRKYWDSMATSTYTLEWDVYNFLLDLPNMFSINEIINNRTDRPLCNPARPDKYLPIGTKLTKYLSTYIKHSGNLPVERLIYTYGDKAFGRKNAAEFVIEIFSHIINSTKKSANTSVVLSINPLDILLASVHTTEWRSCHHIFDGEYRTGPFSYLCDCSTAIAYAYDTISDYENSDAGIVIKKQPVKSWRQMVYLDLHEYLAIHSRQYPCIIPPIEKMAIILSTQILQNASKSKDFRVREGNMSYVTKGDGAFNYVDAASCGIAPENYSAEISIDAGGGVPCLMCGTMRNGDDCDEYAENLIGECCQGTFKCRECGDRLDSNDTYHFGDDTYCHSCYCDNFFDCHHCGDSTNIDEAYTTRHGESICAYCKDHSYSECIVCGNYENDDDVTRANYNGNEEIFCGACAFKYVNDCEGCGVACHDSDLTDGYCKDCFKEEEEEKEEEVLATAVNI